MLHIIERRTLFRGAAVRRRTAATMASVGGRLLLGFTLATLADDGAFMLSHSEDGGRTWAEPHPFYALPGWHCISMGGFAPFDDQHVRLLIGRVQIDRSLGGPEPFTGWHICAADSADGGRTWSEPGPEIRLFPYWTEMYGASNPHRLSDGAYLFACMGTLGRDQGWQAGVTRCPGPGGGFGPPVTIAAKEGLEFSDIDLARLADGRFLAVIREMARKEAYLAWSADEGRSWTPPVLAPFRGSNPKLLTLASGDLACAYRDEDPSRPGVSLSLSGDGGATWRFWGQLYAAETTRHGGLCGYPQMAHTGGGEICCVLHTYAGPDGSVDLHLIRLKEG